MRTAVGAFPLVTVCGGLLSMLGKLGMRDSLHNNERRWASAALRHLRIELDLEGTELIDPSESYLVVPLHEGFIDPVLLLQLGLDLRFVARDELNEWRRLGNYLDSTHQIVVPTEANLSGYRAVIEGAGDAFSLGESLVMFPQGSILGIELGFKSGPVRIAKRFDKPILPVVITGTHQVWEHPFSARLRYGRRVSMSVMPPIPPGDIAERWRDLEREMKAIALGSGMAAARHYLPERDGWWDGYDFEIDSDFAGLAAAVAAHRERTGAEATLLRSDTDSHQLPSIDRMAE